MRAIVLDAAGRPELRDVPEPDGPGELVRVLACGLCGSDVEKLSAEHAGAVLGHEVEAETAGGRRVALVHHAPCGACARCLAGHETTCARFPEPTIVPGGFAERARAHGWVELPAGADGTAVEPLACVLRGAERVPGGRVLVVGQGFVGRLFARVLARRGDEVFALDADPARSGRAPDGPVDAAIVCAPGGAAEAADALEPGGTLLLFADAGAVPAAPVYRKELTVLGSRSSTPRHMEEAAALLPELDLPHPVRVPLDRFAEALELHRSGPGAKVVVVP